MDGRATPKPGTVKAWKQKRRADVDCVVEQERTKGGLVANAPAKLIDIDKVGRSAAAAEALFQRRKRFKRPIDSMREGSLTLSSRVRLGARCSGCRAGCHFSGKAEDR